MAPTQFPVSPGNNQGDFATNEGGAAFGNPKIARQGIKSGATRVEYQEAPPKAPAAPTAASAAPRCPINGCAAFAGLRPPRSCDAV